MRSVDPWPSFNIMPPSTLEVVGIRRDHMVEQLKKYLLLEGMHPSYLAMLMSTWQWSPFTQPLISTLSMLEYPITYCSGSHGSTNTTLYPRVIHVLKPFKGAKKYTWHQRHLYERWSFTRATFFTKLEEMEKWLWFTLESCQCQIGSLTRSQCKVLMGKPLYLHQYLSILEVDGA